MLVPNEIYAFLHHTTTMAPLTAARDLSFLDSHVFSRLKSFDLNGRILSQEPFVVGLGSYSDVYKGACLIAQRGEVMTAMKRLRLHVKADKGNCKQVCPHAIFLASSSRVTFPSAAF